MIIYSFKFIIIDILLHFSFNISAVDQIVILEAPFLEISSDYIIYDTSKLVRSIHGGGKLEAALSIYLSTTIRINLN